MCLASKPKANVLRQKSFKASVQREHRLRVSDQHIYFQRCLHLHEFMLIYSYLCCMRNHMESLCHQMFHLSNTQNIKEKIKTLHGFTSKHVQVTDGTIKEYASLANSYQVTNNLWLLLWQRRSVLIGLFVRRRDSSVLSTWVSLGNLGYQVSHVNRSSGNRKCDSDEG